MGWREPKRPGEFRKFVNWTLFGIWYLDIGISQRFGQFL